MGLVDCEERDLHARELRHEALVVEALRRHVEQAELAPAQPLRHVPHLVQREARVDTRGRDAERRERVDLVLHERDQRRDDHGHAVQQEGRKLIAQALTRARRENRERAAPGQQGGDHVGLARAEVREAEALGEQAARVVECRCGGDHQGRR